MLNRILLYVMLAMALGVITTRGGAQVSSISGGQTVGDFADYLVAKSGDIEVIADASQKAGKAGLAQAQYLLRDMIKKSANEFKYTEASVGFTAIDALAPDQKSKILDLAAWLQDASSWRDDDVMKHVREAQSRLDALFDVTFGDKPHPIVYGIIVKDIADDPDAEPADMRIFGYDLFDKVIRKEPTIKIANHDVPAAMVSRKDGELWVTIPDNVKSLIDFAPSPCVGRETFPLQVTTDYREKRGFWPFNWFSELVSNSQLSALPSPKAYDLSVSYSFQRAENSVSTEVYSRKSEYVVADCDQTVSTSLIFDVPLGARDISCAAAWTGTSSVKDAQGSCKVNGETIDASGAITGQQKVCSGDKLCGCVANARGWLQVEGTYKKDNRKVETINAAAPGKYPLLADASTSIPLSLEAGSKLTHIGVTISKRACPAIYDRADIPFTSDGAQLVAGLSKTGAFRATFKDNMLFVNNATSERSADGSKAN